MVSNNMAALEESCLKTNLRADAIALDHADFRAKMLNQTADFREFHQRIAECVVACEKTKDECHDALRGQCKVVEKLSDEKLFKYTDNLVSEINYLNQRM
jgi:hypothetical protein